MHRIIHRISALLVLAELWLFAPTAAVAQVGAGGGEAGLIALAPVDV